MGPSCFGTVKRYIIGGIVLVAGTGSSCRVLLDDGRVYGVGGAIRLVFDEDDGVEIPRYSTHLIRSLLLKHFEIDDKVDILEHLYNTADPAINALFNDAGTILGKQFVVAAGHLPNEYRAEVNLILVGSVFLSWDVIKSGFIHAVQGSWIPKLHLYRPTDTIAIGAAVLVAKKANIDIHHLNNGEHIETIEFY
ncbi:hypothetical protein DICVIV_07025 [Dictyocaulus viviparus]|uniref:N-acetylglucosamine kinase n=1 Tax=Dictyocaulus viviparus TaxID=29172 RepID=A0A0D8XT18_DICVI|nr:hypothetical protein DICVIV_07025 [Dictyocaulus viviparus]